jgi:hypothetical protein
MELAPRLEYFPDNLVRGKLRLSEVLQLPHKLFLSNPHRLLELSHRIHSLCRVPIWVKPPYPLGEARGDEVAHFWCFTHSVVNSIYLQNQFVVKLFVNQIKLLLGQVSAPSAFGRVFNHFFSEVAVNQTST